jgi:hypothetical protein
MNELNEFDLDELKIIRTLVSVFIKRGEFTDPVYHRIINKLHNKINNYNETKRTQMLNLPPQIIIDSKRYEGQKNGISIGLGNEKVFNMDAIKYTLLKIIKEGKYIEVPKCKEMTISEIEANLGYKIKIVDNK